MELSTSILNGLKCVANFPNDFFSNLIKSVFETFFINTKTGKLELNLDTSAIGKFFFFKLTFRKFFVIN